MKRFLVFIFLAATPLYASSIDAVRAKLEKLSEQGSGRTKATLNSELGSLLYKEGRMKEAAQAFEAALQHDTTRKMRRYIYLYMGKSYESSSRIDKAIPAYELALRYDKKNWRRHRDLGLLYEQAELYRQALASYEVALKRNPKEAGLFLAMGRTWRKLGLYSEAEPWLRQAENAGHRVDQVQEELSLLYEGQGRFGEAATECSKNVSADSTIEKKARLVYLAALAGDSALIKQGKLLLAGAPRETILFYENLVELLRLPSESNGSNTSP